MTELIWEGKYNKDGRRVAPVHVALPFQTVETVNESVQERQQALELFARAQDTEWRNRLIWGDKKYVLPALLDEFAGKVDLIYIDPPFATGQDFSLPVSVNGEGFVKEPSMIEVKAYRDTWGRGLDSYLQWMYETAYFLHALLSRKGSLYVHCDSRVNAYVRALLEEIFSPANYLNEITWLRSASGKTTSRAFPSDTDTILLFVKSTEYIFNEVFQPLSEKTRAMYVKDDSDGRGPYRFFPMQKTSSPGPETTYDYVDNTGTAWKCPPKGWRMRYAKIKALEDDGRIALTGSTLQEKAYWNERENEGKRASNLWNDIPNLQGSSGEMVGYPTQKPEALLSRIIQASSDEGSLVLDCVCGSGTAPVVAEKLGRRWIAGDLGRFAIHTTRKRLLSVASVRPFVVQNLGKYERQLWQAAEFGEAAEVRTRAYQHFVLELYKANPLEGYVWLHGVKQGRMVHVGSVDAPVTVGDVKQIAGEFARAVGTGRDAPTIKAVDVLGWDFAFELNELARQTAGKAGIDVRFWRIPREVLDKRAAEQGDVRFFELAALSVDVETKGRKVTLALKDFVIPLDDVPDEIQRGITDWSQWIDYWAVDWNNKGDAFHNEWQTYRTKKDPKLEKTGAHEYVAAGEYQVVLKVIDILGNDTSKTVTVVVG